MPALMRNSSNKVWQTNMRQRLLTTAAVAAQSTSATGSTQECESQGKLIIAQLSLNNASLF